MFDTKLIDVNFVRWMACAALLGTAGCYTGTDKAGGGSTPDTAAGGEAEAGPADGEGDGDGDGDASAGSDEGGQPDDEAPFEVPTSEVQLLPFHVRMANLVAVTGVPADHAMFGQLWAKRFQLGDHDYAHGVAPDLDWNADRMEQWVKAVKPVCDDPQFQARYPDLASDVTRLARAAYGRDATDDELQAFDEVKLGQVDGAGQYRMVCLAVLTSLEFVAD
ncbi:MAG: hypothetical protein IAG13_24235 [Deltaproteobacteria bacterium]|nr:hypothetical protein [Nannocystaceae bacterium]